MFVFICLSLGTLSYEYLLDTSDWWRAAEHIYYQGVAILMYYLWEVRGKNKSLATPEVWEYSIC